MSFLVSTFSVKGNFLLKQEKPGHLALGDIIRKFLSQWVTVL